MPKRRSPLLLSELELAERSAAAIASSITEGLELPRSQAVLSGYACIKIKSALPHGTRRFKCGLIPTSPLFKVLQERGASCNW